MSFYGERVLPHLVHMSMRQATFEPYRRRVVTAATGRVLEIGVGSGLTSRLYDSATHVIGLEPSAKLLAMARAVRTAGPRSSSLKAWPRRFRCQITPSTPSSPRGRCVPSRT